MRRFNKIAIIGVGLIGGSIGLALRQRRIARKVVGVGYRRSSIDKAVRLKAIDEGTLDLRKGVEDADIVILATPILSMPSIAKRAKPFLKKGSIITDVGSTKLAITRQIERLLPKRLSFVGGHPMAGSEKRGVEKARGDLFKDSICILTKSPATPAKSLRIIKDMWSTLGAAVTTVSPRAHDRIVSEISHLPHMVIFSMLAGIDKKNLRFASTGLSDATRIASSDARVWRDIAVSNKDELIKSISKFRMSLSQLEKAIKKEDGVALLRIFKRAKNRREILLENR